MDRIQKVSSYLVMIFNVLLISVPLVIVIQWAFIEAKITDTSAAINFFGLLERMIQTPEGYINLSSVHWTLLSKILGFSSDILGLLPFILSLFVLKSIFRNYQQGEIFSTINALHYKKLGWLFFLDALIITSLSNTLMVLAVTLTNLPGHRYINIQFGTPNLKSLFFGILLIVISWVMLEASKLQDEQKFTI
jgi:hypothetical protein